MRVPELEKKLTELRESVRVIRFKTEGAKPKNVKESVFLRKDIARILTFINQPRNKAELAVGQTKKHGK